MFQCQIRYLEDESDKTESQIESLSTSEQTRKKGKRDDPKKGEEVCGSPFSKSNMNTNKET